MVTKMAAWLRASPEMIGDGRKWSKIEKLYAMRNNTVNDAKHNVTVTKDEKHDIGLLKMHNSNNKSLATHSNS